MGLHGFAQISKYEAAHGSKQHRICGTTAHNQMLFEKNPAHENFLKSLNSYTKTAQKNSKTASIEVVTIPVVVHVIHSGESIGSGTNISDAQIESQIEILTEDFRRQNADTTNTPVAFQSVAADSKIEFQLATLDPDGLPTSGITRTVTGSAPFNPDFDNMKSSATGGVDIWDRDRYLNIWVCDMGSSGVQGFAQFPGGDASTDGIVLDYRYVGTGGTTSHPYDLGRPGTHEVGHWLGLYHTWGDGDCDDDDGHTDTPNCDGEFYADVDNSCNGPGEQCTGAGDRMIQNYMDYADDGCMNLFTQQQADKMRTVLDGFRLPLQSSNGLGDGTEVPYTNFTSNKTEVIVGGDVEFFSLAAGATSWHWTFAGGTPSSSSDEDPIVTYNSVGTYDVTLVATNANGDSTLTITDYIEVIEAPECYLYTENYNNGTNTMHPNPGGPGYITGHNDFYDIGKAEFFEQINPYDQIISTKYYFADANNTTPGRKIVCKIWDGSTGEPGTELASKDLLISDIVTDVGNFDTTTVTWDSPVNVTDDFFVGFTMDYDGSIADNFVGLYANADGETTPTTAWEQFSDNSWAPFSDAFSWQINISMAIFPVMKESSVTGIDPAVNSLGIFLYPNPADKSIKIKSEGSDIQRVEISSALGLTAATHRTSSKDISIDISNLASGIYLVTIHTNKGVVTQRLVVR